MKYIFITLICTIIGLSVFSQNQEYSSNFIKRYIQAENKSKQSNASLHDGLWKSHFLMEAAKNWSLLTEQAKLLVKPGFKNKGESDRPQFDTEEVYSSTYFTFHYSLSGEYSIDGTDDDQSGDPDYIEWMASLFDQVYESFVDLGYNMPPADNGYGGDDYYDVYIGGDLSGVPAIESGTYGFVSPEDLIGDNPDSQLEEINSFSSWMCMNYDYSWVDGTEEIAVSVTIAHEFMHSIQMGYNQNMDSWFKEACATWSEEANFPGYDDNFQYLMTVFEKPDVALNLDDWSDNLEDSPLAGHWYSSWLFVKYLTEQTEDAIIPPIYESYLEEEDASVIVNNILESEYSTSFDEIFENYLVANKIMSSEQTFAPYIYDRADDYNVLIDNNGGLVQEGEIAYSGSEITFDSEIDGNGRLMRLGADYISLTVSGDFFIKLTPENSNSEINALLYAYNSINGNYRVDNLNLVGNDLTHSANYSNNFDEYTLIVYRYDDSNDTLSEQYSVVVSDISNSISEISKSQISYYPNPVVEQLIFSNSDVVKNGYVNVFDYTGRIVIAKEFEKSINVSELEKGIYFIEVNDNNKLLYKDKFIKN